MVKDKLSNEEFTFAKGICKYLRTIDVWSNDIIFCNNTDFIPITLLFNKLIKDNKYSSFIYSKLNNDINNFIDFIIFDNKISNDKKGYRFSLLLNNNNTVNIIEPINYNLIYGIKAIQGHTLEWMKLINYKNNDSLIDNNIKIIYHITKQSNLISIIKDGLLYYSKSHNINRNYLHTTLQPCKWFNRGNNIIEIPIEYLKILNLKPIKSEQIDTILVNGIIQNDKSIPIKLEYKNYGCGILAKTITDNINNIDSGYLNYNKNTIIGITWIYDDILLNKDYEYYKDWSYAYIRNDKELIHGWIKNNDYIFINPNMN